VNDGQAPCRGCVKAGSIESCILSRPPKKSAVRISRGASNHNESVNPRETRGSDIRLSRSVGVEELRPPNPSKISDGNLDVPSSPPWSKIRQRFEEYPSNTWARATIIFRTHFPEYGFNHPSELESSSDVISDYHRLKLTALLSVAARYEKQETSGDIPNQHQFVLTELQHCLTDTPSLALVQAYHLVALYEWGEGRTYPAWIYVGVAIRMLQSLLAIKDQTHVRLSQPSRMTEVESRTYWSCALLEKHVSNSKGRPALLSLREPVPPFPTSDDDFLFGPISASAREDHAVAHHGSVDYTLLRNIELEKPVFVRMLALGMDIWSRIHQWVALGGRKQPRMMDPDNSPWKATSQWAMMREELQLWREAHHPRHKFPETPIMAHVYLHQAAPVVHLNLVYYLR
jgi:hypothetical protein